MKARQLTKLQWEFMLTAWRQTVDFGVVERSANQMWKWGAFAFYYTRGRWIHGTDFKYPLYRFAGVAEETIAPHVYLDWTGSNRADTPPRAPRLIRKHANSNIDELLRGQKGRPFDMLGKPTRVLELRQGAHRQGGDLTQSTASQRSIR